MVLSLLPPPALASSTIIRAEVNLWKPKCNRFQRRCLLGSFVARAGLQTQSQTETPTIGELGGKAKQKQVDREFFIDLLSSAATKRDAKAFISRLKAAPQDTRQKVVGVKSPVSTETSIARPGVNLGTFFGHARAVEQSPKFHQDERLEHSEPTVEQEVHHLALVKVIGPEKLEETTLQGLGLTLSQLCRLGMTPCVVLECTSPLGEDAKSDWREEMKFQAQRLADAINSNSSGIEARVLDNVYCQSDETKMPRIFSRKLLMAPIRQGKLPIILPQAYSDEMQLVRYITADQALLALAREYAGLNLSPTSYEEPVETRQRSKALQKQTSLDRLIILDPDGGVPHPALPGTNHVFLNLEQEYQEVRRSLLDGIKAAKKSDLVQHAKTGIDSSFPPSLSGVCSTLVGEHRQEATTDTCGTRQPSLAMADTGLLPSSLTRALQNLELLREALTYLPPSSSAIVTTPLEAAKSSKNPSNITSISGVGTRTQKNPLIHNLLTDKPSHSASLPAGRLGRSNGAVQVSPVVSTSTFVKKGMPLTIIPDPQSMPWSANGQGEPRLKLLDPRIDLSRLVHLIDDSFNRKLDVKHYLDRVHGHIAGLIIAGEYEGGALFTWETPPGASPSDPSRQVPYLDKFAVLKRSQGAGGVADVVFNAMVRGCFPDGVCWRSRRDNPVNKWYFERARGTWKIPGTNWTMFWTTEGVEAGVGQRFEDYEAVCRAVEPSWADTNRVPD